MQPTGRFRRRSLSLVVRQHESARHNPPVAGRCSVGCGTCTCWPWGVLRSVADFFSECSWPDFIHVRLEHPLSARFIFRAVYTTHPPQTWQRARDEVVDSIWSILYPVVRRCFMLALLSQKFVRLILLPNQSAAANRRPALRLTMMDNMNIFTAFHARGPAVAELGR